jgi:hypothetical protein
MNAKVSVIQAVNKVLDYTGTDNVNDIPVLVDWAVEADRAIGSFYDWEKKIYVLDIVGCQAELPNGTVWVRGIILGDAGCDCDSTFDFAEKMDHTDIQETFKEWNRLCASARAESSRPSETEMSDIVGIMNDPLSGVGMALPSTYYD